MSEPWKQIAEAVDVVADELLWLKRCGDLNRYRIWNARDSMRALAAGDAPKGGDDDFWTCGRCKQRVTTIIDAVDGRRCRPCWEIETGLALAYQHVRPEETGGDDDERGPTDTGHGPRDNVMPGEKGGDAPERTCGTCHHWAERRDHHLGGACLRKSAIRYCARTDTCDEHETTEEFDERYPKLPRPPECELAEEMERSGIVFSAEMGRRWASQVRALAAERDEAVARITGLEAEATWAARSLNEKCKWLIAAQAREKDLAAVVESIPHQPGDSHTDALNRLLRKAARTEAAEANVAELEARLGPMTDLWPFTVRDGETITDAIRRDAIEFREMKRHAEDLEERLKRAVVLPDDENLDRHQDALVSIIRNYHGTCDCTLCNWLRRLASAIEAAEPGAPQRVTGVDPATGTTVSGTVDADGRLTIDSIREPARIPVPRELVAWLQEFINAALVSQMALDNLRSLLALLRGVDATLVTREMWEAAKALAPQWAIFLPDRPGYYYGPLAEPVRAALGIKEEWVPRQEESDADDAPADTG